MTRHEKVLKALKTKYKNLGLSEETLNTMAENLCSRLTDESTDTEIDAEVDGVENFLKSFQKEVDGRVTSAVKKAKEPAPKSTEENPNPEKKEQTDIEKAIAAALAPLMAEVNSLKSEKVGSTRKQTLEAALEKIDPKLKAKVLKDFGRMSFDKDEDFDSYLEETVSDLGEFGSEAKNQGAGFIRKPARSAGGSDGKATAEEISAVVDSIM